MNLTKSDIEALMEAMRMVVIGAMTADSSRNVMDMMREAVAAGGFFDTAAKDYQDHGIVRLVIDLLNAERQVGKVGRVQTGYPSLEDIMEAVNAADQVLSGHPDAMAFRHFLYQLAMAVANAVDEGEGTSRISERERTFLDMLKTKSKAGDKSSNDR